MRRRADIYFTRTVQTLEAADLDPVVSMEVFCRKPGVLCGMSDAHLLIQGAVANAGREVHVTSLCDGAVLGGMPPYPVMHVRGHYVDIGELETELLGTLASNTGWASAAREIRKATDENLGTDVRIVAMGARHIHPSVSAAMQRAAIAGGVNTGTTAEAVNFPAGTMPHALMLCVGDTVRAARLFHEAHPEEPLHVLVDTFKDEVEEAIRVAIACPALRSVRIDTPSERGGVTPGLVRELRAKLDAAGAKGVDITVSGGMTPEKIRKLAGCPINGIGVGSYIAHAEPIDFTADIKVVDGAQVAKRGRLPGLSYPADGVFPLGARYPVAVQQ